MLKSLSVLCFAFVLLASGCGAPTAPSSGTPQWGALNTISGVAVTSHGDSIYGKAVAQFWNGSVSDTAYLQVAKVTMNTLPLVYSKIPTLTGSSVQTYSINDQSIYSDSLCQWHVEGANGIDSFDTAGYRPANLRISSPTPDSTITESTSGFTINWPNPIAHSKIDVEVDDAQGNYDQILGLDDTGSKTITPDQITHIKKGPIVVYVYRTNLVSKVIGAHGYVLTLGTQSSIALTLQ